MEWAEWAEWGYLVAPFILFGIRFSHFVLFSFISFVIDYHINSFISFLKEEDDMPPLEQDEEKKEEKKEEEKVEGK